MKRILSVVLTLVLAAALTACGSATAQPQDVFQDYITALQQGDYQQANTYLTPDAGDLTQALEKAVAEDAIKAWLSRMQVQNVQQQVNGDQATLTYELVAPDLKVVITDVWNEMMELIRSPEFVAQLPQGDEAALAAKQQEIQEMTIQKLIERFADPEAPIATHSGTATLVKTDDGWKISAMDVAWDFQSQ